MVEKGDGSRDAGRRYEPAMLTTLPTLDMIRLTEDMTVGGKIAPTATATAAASSAYSTKSCPERSCQSFAKNVRKSIGSCLPV